MEGSEHQKHEKGGGRIPDTGLATPPGPSSDLSKPEIPSLAVPQAALAPKVTAPLILGLGCG